MTEQPAAADPVRPWQIATAVLAVVCLTLLVIAFVLRARADNAKAGEEQAVAAQSALEDQVAQEKTRNDALFNQLSRSNERWTEIAKSLGVPASSLSVSASEIRRAVAAQRQAGNARERAAAQRRTAQLCAAASLDALQQIHAGPDIESGSDKALATVREALPACREALG